MARLLSLLPMATMLIFFIHGGAFGQSEATSYVETVKQVQTDLKALGLYAGTVDGVVGPETRAAISAYQKTLSVRSHTIDQGITLVDCGPKGCRY